MATGSILDSGTASGLHVGVAGPASPQMFAADLGMAAEDLPLGLGGTPVNHLVRAWLDLGHRVTLATLDRSIAPGADRTFQNGRLTIVVGPYRRKRRARDAFAVEREAVRTALRTHRPDAVSAHWSYEYALGAVASGVPTLVTVRDVPKVVFRHQPGAYRAVRWAMHRQALARAAGVAFVSAYTRDAIGRGRWHGAPILPNAMPDAAWRLPTRPPPDPERPVFVSVNHGFGARKNVGLLMEAFAAIRREHPGARLRLIGQGFGPDGPAAAWAVAQGLDEGIEYLDRLPYASTLDQVRLADVLVHPSLEETFGYTLIEAASVGTPVVAGRSSGAVPWVLADGAAGVLVDVGSATAIAEAMSALTADPDRWSALRARAFDNGRTRFSASSVAQAYLRVLAELPGARP